MFTTRVVCRDSIRQGAMQAYMCRINGYYVPILVTTFSHFFKLPVKQEL